MLSRWRSQTKEADWRKKNRRNKKEGVTLRLSLVRIGERWRPGWDSRTVVNAGHGRWWDGGAMTRYHRPPTSPRVHQDSTDFLIPIPVPIPILVTVASRYRHPRNGTIDPIAPARRHERLFSTSRSSRSGDAPGRGPRTASTTVQNRFVGIETLVFRIKCTYILFSNLREPAQK